MRYNELHQIFEGPNDKHIFKAVFMAGGPGSGKSTIANMLFGGEGLKLVDRDQILLQFTKMNKEIDRSHIGELRDKTRNHYIDGRLGMIIDGTARKSDSILKLKTELESFGYETIMVFVHTDLDTAKERVLARATATGRVVPESVVVNSWYESQNNLENMHRIFGDNLFEVENTNISNVSQVGGRIRSWLHTPTINPQVTDWLTR